MPVENTEISLRKACASTPQLELKDLQAWQPQFQRLPFSEAARKRCALFRTSTASAPLQWVTTDFPDVDAIAWARTRFGQIEVHSVASQTFDAWLSHAEHSMTALEGLAGLNSDSLPKAVGSEQSISDEHLSLRGIDASQSPAVRFVNSTLYDAMKMGASDIHLESNPVGLVVKFRVDGVLTAMHSLSAGASDVSLAEQVISRIKVMAQLDIAERRIPQDGRLQIQFGDQARARTIDVRVSIMPSIHGEDAVLRILDRQHLAQSLAGLTLQKLGYDASTQHALKALCRKPHGMLLVTGPTGSGKTTTLYAAITETHESRDKVITIEDPVEYQLPGVLQIPVNERKGLTFAKGLRSILRHDPDKILVGEIRDAETAQIAVQSALTGHLVFTTVHANNVFDVVGRFEQFGIDAYTLASAMNGVLAQRLLRKLCEQCAQPMAASDAQAVHQQMLTDLVYQRAWDQMHEPRASEKEQPRFLRPVGCEHCRGTGYLGRFALGELFTLTSQAKALIARKASQAELQHEAQRAGWRSMKHQAALAAIQGRTSLDEANRVAG